MIAASLLLLQLNVASPHLHQAPQKTWSWINPHGQVAVVIDSNNGIRVIGIQLCGTRITDHQLTIHTGNYYISINTSQL